MGKFHETMLAASLAMAAAREGVAGQPEDMTTIDSAVEQMHLLPDEENPSFLRSPNPRFTGHYLIDGDKLIYLQEGAGLDPQVLDASVSTTEWRRATEREKAKFHFFWDKQKQPDGTWTKEGVQGHYTDLGDRVLFISRDARFTDQVLVYGMDANTGWRRAGKADYEAVRPEPAQPAPEAPAAPEVEPIPRETPVPVVPEVVEPLPKAMPSEPVARPESAESPRAEASEEPELKLEAAELLKMVKNLKYYKNGIWRASLKQVEAAYGAVTATEANPAEDLDLSGQFNHYMPLDRGVLEVSLIAIPGENCSVRIYNESLRWEYPNIGELKQYAKAMLDLRPTLDTDIFTGPEAGIEYVFVETGNLDRFNVSMAESVASGDILLIDRKNNQYRIWSHISNHIGQPVKFE